MIAIVDYGHGNIFSISQALRHLGAECVVSNRSDKILGADGVILPGVGAFGSAMRGLRRNQLIEPLHEVAARKIPMLGICLGMQLLGDSSEEFGHHEGLGLIPGTVGRLSEGHGGPDTVRIPNVGWRRLSPTGRDPLLSGVADGTMVYFVHSFHLRPDNSTHVSATTTVNDCSVAAAVRIANVVGYQFHPENSGPAGLDLLRRFLRMETEG